MRVGTPQADGPMVNFRLPCNSRCKEVALIKVSIAKRILHSGRYRKGIEDQDRRLAYHQANNRGTVSSEEFNRSVSINLK